MKILFVCLLYFVLQDIYSYSYASGLLFDRSRRRLIIVFLLLSLHWHFGTLLVPFYCFSVLLPTLVYLNTSRDMQCYYRFVVWFSRHLHGFLYIEVYNRKESQWSLSRIDYYSPVKSNGVLNWRVGGLLLDHIFTPTYYVTRS